jgi:hypothetical protein
MSASNELEPFPSGGSSRTGSIGLGEVPARQQSAALRALQMRCEGGVYGTGGFCQG